jgi:ankyrin repeat protein
MFCFGFIIHSRLEQYTFPPIKMDLYEEAKKSGDFKEIKTSDDVLELLHAVQQSNLEQVKKLVTANPHLLKGEDGGGKTALTFASHLGLLDIVHFLVDSGADLNHVDLDEFTPLIYCVKNSHQKVIEYLLDKGADINPMTSKMVHPSHQAADRGDIQMMKFLLSKGARLDHKWGMYGGPIHWAALGGHKKMIEFLMEQGESINDLDLNGGTMLHMLTMSNDVEFYKFLISMGANVDIQTTDKSTALHLACEGGNYEIVRVLLANNAKFLKNAEGVGPSALATGEVKKYFDLKCYEWKEKGNELFRKPNMDGALEKYMRALDYDEKNAGLLTNISLVHYHLKNWEESLRFAEMSIVENPRWSKGYYRRGMALKALGRDKEADLNLKRSDDLENAEKK